MRVCFVTSQSIGDDAHSDPDIPYLNDAAERAGLIAQWCAWEDDAVNWDAFDLVIMRSPWNYVKELSRFQKWLSTFPAPQKLWNPRDVIQWNMNKAYLRELANDGFAVVPTLYVDSIDDVDAAIRACPVFDDGEEIILKPAISAGSYLTGRFSRTHSDVLSFAYGILEKTGTLMIQPAIPSVAANGELSCVFFGSEFSHSFRKGPILAANGGFIDSTYSEKISGETVPEAVMELATALHGHLTAKQPLLYARYDMVVTNAGSPMLLEAELFEPSFFFATSPQSADEFCRKILALGN